MGYLEWIDPLRDRAGLCLLDHTRANVEDPVMLDRHSRGTFVSRLNTFSFGAAALLLLAGASFAADAALPPEPGIKAARLVIDEPVLNRTTIYMRTAEIDTARTLPATRDVVGTLMPEGRALDTQTRYVIQLNETITPELRARITQAGVNLHEYMQVNAFIATVRPEADRGAIAALDAIRFATPYRDAWKLDREIGVRDYLTPERQNLRDNGRVAVIVTLHEDAALQPVLNEIAKLNAPLIHAGEVVAKNMTVSITIDRADVAGLAQLPSVQFIEDAFENTERSNYSARWIMQSNVGSPTPLFPLYANGLKGAGQVLGHIDSSVNVSHCSFRDAVNPVGPLHRKVISLNGTSGSSTHGSHTAATAVGFDPASADSSNVNGVAPDAKMVHSNTPNPQNEANLQNLLNLHYSQGARVHTNSWGDDGTNAYTGQCRGLDNHAYLNEDSVVVFAVTNTSLIKTPENAKNAFAVNRSTHSPNAEGICGTTCAGPTPDQRRKPEIMAPGCSLVSSSGTGTVCTTSSLTGTSMACPNIAGMALLFREYFVDGFYPSGAPNASDGFNPSSALIRAAMMNSAVDMTGTAGWPGNQEGWGRVLADNALFFPGDARKLVVWDVRNAQGLSTGQQTEYTVNVTAGQPFEATIVWTEPPAAVNSNPSITNNLDFEVIDPANNLFRGNVLSGSNSVTGGTADNRNNTEMVVFQAPAAGSYTLRIKGTAVNQGTQGYALVVTGDVSSTPPPPPAPQSFRLSSPADGATGVSLTPTLSWNNSLFADTYAVTVATDPSLTTVVDSASGITGTSYNINPGVLSHNATYYWGVVSTNVTGTANSIPVAASFVTVPPPCVGDLDGDNDRDVNDLTLFLGAFGTSVTPGTGADFDNNGQVDVNDLTTFLANFAVPC
ncbi:MAG: S8 family serine peptidase [Phycisphaerales bacterium]